MSQYSGKKRLLDKQRRLREKNIDDTMICNTAGNVTAGYGSIFGVLESLWD